MGGGGGGVFSPPSREKRGEKKPAGKRVKIHVPFWLCHIFVYLFYFCSRFYPTWDRSIIRAGRLLLRNLRWAFRLFFRVAQFALRIYEAICVFAICALKLRRQF